ncbi:MAG: alcohol dehydrogenase catalytic domain-containing protein [Rhodospirillales bacterium]|nr:alcohol dehydrogenase catalytic domain-containing protein [Rhodospirillales bacterium]
MKALVYTGPEQIDFRDEPDPSPADGEAIVKVEAVGICGSDMHAYRGHDARRPAPLILGHEACGIVQGGKFAGKRVTLNPLVTCGVCEACRAGRTNLCAVREIISMPPRQGAFAEYLRIPERNLIALPAGMDPAIAALSEPMATAWHAVSVGEHHLLPTLKTIRALVLGGGAIGLSVALVLRSRGCPKICVAETNPLRRETVALEKDFVVIDPATEPVEENGFELVVDAVGGVVTRAAASVAIKPGGVIVHIGLLEAEGGLDVRKFTLQEVTFVGTYTYTMADFQGTVAALDAGVLGALNWVEKRPMAEGAAAFHDLMEGRTGAAKIILMP